ncbi:HlyD family type I secretion periplasmic adaptor subunit [Paracoccus sp. S-4012]|uniref:HlyD family type I secretion periplasmic adaptor subunit n=1 Tax=Paracoccus sp. S-4012 TaxID=2665648 RepID=UPI0012AF6272|nr:HlyD family type I secretion periplasmic adaptor subunit [Paracoccus sp. S-4012]MRX49970.1 HlyD family type I secretion periplasmic adaptor subunit [Paracoccus sp. S-4012]
MSTSLVPQQDWSMDAPRSVGRFVIFGLVLMAVSFGGFGLWAFRAPLSAAVLSSGTFVATGRNKIVQHLEGGVIDEILVAEGDRVEAGTPLVRLDQTAPLANLRELTLRRARLEAIAARLRAEYAGEDRVDWPPFFEEQRADPEIRDIVVDQQTNFDASRAKFASDILLLQSNIAAAQARLTGFDDQLDSLLRQKALLQEDYDARAQLLDRGLVRRPEVNALSRAIADADGEAGRLRSQRAEVEEMITKARTQIEQARNEDRSTTLDEMQTIDAELDSVREQSMTAENVLTRAEIHSPVAGTVVRLHYHTAGGVIEPGKPILEILPNDVPLIVETQVLRTDVDSIRIGQRANIRLTALNQRTTPVLEGELIYLSADAIPVNAADGTQRDVYLVRVDIPQSELARIRGFSPTPGMPAEVMIETASRTFAQYLVKPISDSLARAFLEN